MENRKVKIDSFEPANTHEFKYPKKSKGEDIEEKLTEAFKEGLRNSNLPPELLKDEDN